MRRIQNFSFVKFSFVVGQVGYVFEPSGLFLDVLIMFIVTLLELFNVALDPTLLLPKKIDFLGLFEDRGGLVFFSIIFPVNYQTQFFCL